MEALVPARHPLAFVALFQDAQIDIPPLPAFAALVVGLNDCGAMRVREMQDMLEGDLAVVQLCISESDRHTQQALRLEAALERAGTMVRCGAIKPSLCRRMCQAYIHSMPGEGRPPLLVLGSTPSQT